MKASKHYETFTTTRISIDIGISFTTFQSPIVSMRDCYNENIFFHLDYLMLNEKCYATQESMEIMLPVFFHLKSGGMEVNIME